MALRSPAPAGERGVAAHSAVQCIGSSSTRNDVVVPLGAVANGKHMQIEIAYDQSAGTGGYRD